MKRVLLLVLVLVIAVAGCGKKATREIDLATDKAEDADFSSADLFTIADGMVNSMQADGFAQIYASQHMGEKPIMVIAKTLENNTDEHVNTRLILEKIRTAMSKAKLGQFIEDKAYDQALAELNMQASDLFDKSKAAQFGKFVGAKYFLGGTITNLRKQDGRETLNYMNITLSIFDIETLLIKWTDEVEYKRGSTKGKIRG